MSYAIRIVEPEGPDKPALSLGSVVSVRGNGVKGYAVTSHNDVGGTIGVPEGVYRVRIVREWWDYETGQHYAAMLTNQSDLNRILRAAKTEFTPKAKDFDPSMVFFCDDAICS